ncbi:MAG TPA: acyl-CoA synthetase [Pseudomonadota bacterium]|nr:acyl-CoA synthetase [Pseudomonadota bacterium]
MPIRTLADVVELEKTPIRERLTEQNVYERLQKVANRIPDRLAFRSLMTGDPTEVPRDVTYRDFVRKTTQAANLFISLGVGPQDVVSLLIPLVPEAFFALFGAMVAGIANPLNPMLEPAHLRSILREASTSVLVAAGDPLSPETWSRVEGLRSGSPTLKAVLRIGGTGAPPPGIIDFESALAAQPAEYLIASRPSTHDTVAALFHTGGTTGRPKLARHTHGGLLLTAWTNAITTSDDQSEIVLAGLPLFHIAGAIILGLTRLYCGQTSVLLTPNGLRNPAVLRNHWALAERFRATIVGGVPTSLAVLLDMPADQHDRSHIKLCFSGAAALPVEIGNRFQERFKLPVCQGYGMTEVHGFATVNPIAGECRSGSVGLRMPYLELKIAEVSPSGEIRRFCETEEIGHILMRGPQVFAGYLDPSNNHKMLIADGWLDSNDLGRLDSDGYLWLTGRAKDLIIRGGHNIDPEMIEQVLNRHPAVALTAAVGCPDAHAGELPVAFVQPRPGQTFAVPELLAFCRQHIPERAAIPVEIFLVPRIPLTAVGKIHKSALRREAARFVFTRQLAKLAEVGVKTQVEVVDHPKHGTLARIIVKNRGTLDQKALEERCRTLLGGYQIRHEVVPAGPPK